MKYDHVVKYNGVYYPAGKEVPDEKKAEEPKTSASPIEEEIAPKKKPGRPPKNKE